MPHRSTSAPLRASAVGRRLAPVRRALGRARDLLPFTNLGLALAGAGAAAYFWFAVPQLDYVVRVVAGLALILVAAALAAVTIGAILTHRAWNRRARAGAEEVLGFEARRGFLPLLRLPGFRFLPLIDLSWVWESPEGFTVELAQVDGDLAENVECASRRRTDEITRRFTIEDGFGLARIVLRRRERRPLRVLPWTGELINAPMLRALSGGDDVPHPHGQLTGDRVDIRRYVPGDPLRLVLWKVYARTRELMVRTPERAIAPAVRIVAYLPAAEGDEPAAAAARVAVEGHLFGEGWVFSADGANGPATDIPGANELIAGSRAARGTDRGEAAGLASFLEVHAASEPVRIILFVPARPGPWMERAAAAIRKYGSSVSVLIVTDGVRDAETPERKVVDRLLRLPEAPEPDADDFTTHDAIAEVARTLAAMGGAAQIAAVERPTGRTLALGVRSAARRVA